jgi:putative polyhydroxyalkanoate system protein
MPDIHLERDHQLGLARARRVARRWADEAEQKFEMACHIVEGPEGDTVEFSRSGVKGALRVEADRFTLDAKLGFLLGAFSKTIESEIEKNLDQLLSSERPPAKAAGSKKK